ncbi:tail fiber protein [Escherichia phage vB_EcoS_SA80RD]|nr:tail fiber protein [Escherichia phage vB_EcoS_SA80RD]
MATRLYGILTDGLNKPIVNATVALLAKGNTITVLNGSEAVFRTDREGAYNVTVQAGHYKVIIGPQGLEPYKAGEIVIYSDSPEGSLNGYLINWAPEELTPDVIKQVQQLVANSEEYALQAGRSAAAANADATDARNSKASAAQSASDALVYKNDAKASEDAAKQAQAGAAGSANTATQAVTTIQGLKSDVEQLKTDTQGIKDSAVTETTALKDAAAASAAQASNSATEAGQQASNAAGSAQSASTDAGRAEVAAGKAEQVISQALLKDNNLSDLTNIDSARSVLKIDRIDQTEPETRLKSNQDKQYLFINTNNLNIPGSSAWGVYNTEGGIVPLTIECGGTGARQPDHVRINLDVPSNAEAFLIKNNLSEITDKDSAWKNVQPEGSLPLSGDPVDDLDATTKRWVEDKFNTGIANTSWSVINGDSTRPNSFTRASSGKVLAQYKIGESLEAQAELRSDAYIDGMYYAIMSIYNNTKGVTKELAFDDSGLLNSDRYSARYGTMMGWNQTGSTKGTFSMEDQAIGANYAFNSLLSGAQYSQAGYKTSCHWGMIHHNATSFAQSVWHIAGDDNNAYGVRVAIQPFNSDIYFHKWQPGSEEAYTLQKNATSDRRLKHSIENTTVEKALENIKNLNFVTFVYNNDNLQRVRRGVIAQETEVIEPLYVKTRKFYDNSGIEQEQKELDTTPMLLDTIHVVQTLIKRIESLEEDNKKLKEIISNLNTSQTTDLP